VVPAHLRHKLLHLSYHHPPGLICLLRRLQGLHGHPKNTSCHTNCSQLTGHIHQDACKLSTAPACVVSSPGPVKLSQPLLAEWQSTAFLYLKESIQGAFEQLETCGVRIAGHDLLQVNFLLSASHVANTDG
jgi:hypothetical protein